MTARFPKRVPIFVRVSPAHVEMLTRLAHDSNLTRGRVMEVLLEHARTHQQVTVRLLKKGAA